MVEEEVAEQICPAMKWEKFTGTIKGSDYSAVVEMMDLPDPFWQASFKVLTAEKYHMSSRAFEEGKLEQAYEWCVDQVKQHEQRLKLRGDSQGEAI